MLLCWMLCEVWDFIRKFVAQIQSEPEWKLDPSVKSLKLLAILPGVLLLLWERNQVIIM